jgi:hypothetical protein
MGITDGYCFGDKGKFELHFVWLPILGIYLHYNFFPLFVLKRQRKVGFGSCLQAFFYHNLNPLS